jgi:hypothetical protein
VAYFLFVDESGGDRGESPYEVLAGVAVEDRDVWNLIDALKNAEERAFGTRYSHEHDEIKGKKILKRKVFRHASQLPAIPEEERRQLARECLAAGPTANRRQITALAQAKLAFVRDALELCGRFHCRAFASIVDRNAPRPLRAILRKDYAFLFERFFYFLEDRGATTQGAVVFDELERTQAHILIGQMEEYFLKTARGRERSRQVIPQPFFVHSDLTTLIQIADLVAYVVAWGFRIPGTLEAAARTELASYATQVAGLRYKTERDLLGRPDFVIWSFAVISDLRGWEDRAAP